MIAKDADTTVATLPNGVRLVAIRLPHIDTVSVSVFVRTGSRHESARLNGISHVVEHMAFKGTDARSARQINQEAERLGADVNAHTDKDHTAYHLRGLARDAAPFVRMLAEIVQQPSFPEAELELERQVILQELMEDEDDPVSTAFKLYDRGCYGKHPIGQPVIGTRPNIERFTRDDLLGYVQRQYGGANVVVGIAGNIDPAALLREAEAAFGAMPAGAPNAVAPPAYIGGYFSRRQAGSSQSHVVLGFPIPAAREEPQAAIVAAALLGEGMSSPLMRAIREERALVYYAACSADIGDLAGQFVIEASTTPEHLDELFAEAARLLVGHAERIDIADLQRARNQLAVRSLRAQERPFQRLEDAALDLFIHGRVRSRAELVERIGAVTARQVRAAFATMLEAGATVAVAGRFGRGLNERLAGFVEECRLR